MNRSNISRCSLLLLYKFYFQCGSSIPRFLLSSWINMSISSGELQWIPLFVHNSHVTLLPNWFLKQTGRNGLSWKSTETLQSSPGKQKTRVWRGRWPGSWRCHPEAAPSPAQSTTCHQFNSRDHHDTRWDHPSKWSPARNTDTTSRRSLEQRNIFLRRQA